MTYPITFLLTDTVAEIWGQRRAAFMVYAGFFMSFVMMAVLWIAVALPPAAAWTYPAYATTQESQLAYEATFSAPGVLVLASMTAYLVAQLIDVRLYHFWWRVTGGKHLWLRNNGSTWISQLVDTIIVNSIFLRFGLDLEWKVIGSHRRVLLREAAHRSARHAAHLRVASGARALARHPQIPRAGARPRVIMSAWIDAAAAPADR